MMTVDPQGNLERWSDQPSDQTKTMADTERNGLTLNQPAGPQDDPPPDGGWRAWLQVLGSWMLIFNTWGTSGPVQLMQHVG